LKVLVLHGPNLNLLGQRDPTHYGRVTLSEIEGRLAEVAEAAGAQLESRQSNHEGELVGWLQAAAFGDAGERRQGVVMNPGGYGHTSVALRDAVDAVVAAGVPVVEVHLSNVHGREPFRERLLTGAVASGIVSGLGPLSYELGLRAAIALAQRST
jgi:3-dehydroquinate dehydratase II